MLIQYKLRPTKTLETYFIGESRLDKFYQISAQLTDEADQRSTIAKLLNSTVPPVSRSFLLERGAVEISVIDTSAEYTTAALGESKPELDAS